MHAMHLIPRTTPHPCNLMMQSSLKYQQELDAIKALKGRSEFNSRPLTWMSVLEKQSFNDTIKQSSWLDSTDKETFFPEKRLQRNPKGCLWEEMLILLSSLASISWRIKQLKQTRGSWFSQRDIQSKHFIRNACKTIGLHFHLNSQSTRTWDGATV